MPSLNAASVWLDDKLQDTQAETFRYLRGSAFVDVTAVFAEKPIGFALAGGVEQSWQATDLLVPVDELVLGGHAIEPEAGDRVEVTINGALIKFLVSEGDDSRTHRHVDRATGTQFRIHLREAR